MSSVEAILDAAERIFATHGYEGASMRQIAEQAGVAQALLHYHFKTKEKLYAAVFSRRSAPINAQRKARLDVVLADGHDATLEDVLDALFLPAPDSRDERDGRNFYQQMVTAISVADDEHSKSLMIGLYDPIARQFVAALQKALPGLSEVSAVWAYLFALGARMQANARNARASRLSKGAIAKGDMTSAQTHLIPFVAAGIRQLARQSSVLNTKISPAGVDRQLVASKNALREARNPRLRIKNRETSDGNPIAGQGDASLRDSERFAGARASGASRERSDGEYDQDRNIRPADRPGRDLRLSDHQRRHRRVQKGQR